ncbi:MAG: substrate-binding domain-containing protein [Candidatus Methanosuratus sp.]|nr:substrate-binding domain-containing protein [Candidatus Methanosuratincola sp.]
MDPSKAALLASAAILAVLFSIAFLGTSGEKVIVATTTSTADSGLIDYIKPYFEAEYGVSLSWISLGTGQAIAVASRGDADILLIHDREREEQFVSSGNGTLRVTVFYNDFIVVGPIGDPASASSQDAKVCMGRIADAGRSGTALFISRGDGSGTHSLEKRLWAASGIRDYENSGWYKSAGSGMAATLRLANELGAYTITDRATFCKLKESMGDALKLIVVCEGDPALFNPYSLVLLNPSRYPNIRYGYAIDFLLFITSPEGQGLIGNYTLSGERLFFPVYGKTECLGLPPEDEAVAFIEDLRAHR